MSGWESTFGAVLRQGRAGTAALATVHASQDSRPRADQYPDAAMAHRTAWGSAQWAYEVKDPSDPEQKRTLTHFANNAEVRSQQQLLAEQGAPIGWCDFPNLGFPPPELRPLFALAAAKSARAGTVGPDGIPDAEMQRMLAEADFNRTPWAGRAGLWPACRAGVARARRSGAARLSGRNAPCTSSLRLSRDAA